VRRTNIPYTIISLSLSLLLSQSWNRLDYEIRSKMLDYWVGFGLGGTVLDWTVFHHRIIPSRGRLFMFSVLVQFRR
jgi:hypothetical protein